MTVFEIIALGEQCGWQAHAHKAVASCPLEFFAEDNLWQAKARKLYSSVDTSEWKWKTPDNSLRERELLVVLSLLSSFWISRDQKTAVAGWMLSEILSDP